MITQDDCVTAVFPASDSVLPFLRFLQLNKLLLSDVEEFSFQLVSSTFIPYSPLAVLITQRD